MSRPAIILTSKFTLPNQDDFGRYANYMSRKKALEEKGYLTEVEKEEFEKISDGLNVLKFDPEVKQSYQRKGEEKVIKEAKELLNKNNIATTEDNEFDKYVGYMTRKGALADKQNLTQEETTELKRLDKATAKFESNQIERGKLLQGVFSSDTNEIHLNELDGIRKNLRDGEKNGSVLWQDVVSFDNEFLIKQGILDPSTDTLDESLLRQASRQMMDTFAEKENLNNPYWLASIHRNRDHIHIHFATVESSNSRKVELHEDEQQPRGKRALSTIDAMKMSFTNEMVDMTPLLDKITQGRNNVRGNIQGAYLKNINNPGFQMMMNDFSKTLPDDRRKWNYGSLQKEQKQKINKIVDTVLKDDPEYQALKKNIHKYSENRKELYGTTSRDSKDYEKNKLNDIQKRNANALLFSLKEMDKKARFYQNKVPINPRSNPDNYIQEMLKSLEQSKNPNRVRLTQKQYQREIQKKPILNRSRARKIEHLFDKARLTPEKQKALREYERMMEGTSTMFDEG